MNCSKIKEDVRRLWKECFHDSEDFMNLFFNKVYNDENVFVRYESDELVCALQSLPYALTFYGELLPIRYYAGVSTSEKWRNKGMMSTLIKDALISCRESMVCLLPAEDWLYDYYSKFGFASVFHNRVENFECDIEMSTTIAIRRGVNSKVLEYCLKKERQRNCCLIHSLNDFEIVAIDNSLSSGKIVYIEESNSIKGVAFCYLDGSDVVIKDAFFEEEQKLHLLGAVRKIYGSGYRIRMVVPGRTRRFGMVRLLQVENILSILSHRFGNMSLSLNVKDNIVNANTGYYLIGNGSVCKTNLQDDNPCVTINELADMLFGELIFGDGKLQSAYMSLMLE